MDRLAEVLRVCLVGPESTGKTELAQQLARELDTVAVPEYAREYALARDNELSFDDVGPIALGQLDLEAHLASRANGVLLLDTDLVSTVVYARHYYDDVPEWVEEEAQRRLADLYLLLDTDVPWVEDPCRDCGQPEAREDVFDAFRRTLDDFGARFMIVSGSWQERAAVAREAIAAMR